MNSVPNVAPASNAAPAPKVRIVSPPRGKIEFPAVLTDELFERWLDLHPGRRKSYEDRDEKEKVRDRVRITNMYALRGCQFTLDLEKAEALAAELDKQLEKILRLYAPNEAERVLLSANLPIPSRDDFATYGPDTFANSHRACKKLRRRLDKFFVDVGEIRYVMPNGDCDEQEEDLSC